MIISIHIADVDAKTGVRALRNRSHRGPGPGAGYLEWTFRVPLGGRVPALPSPRRLAAIASWESDAALEDFLGSDPLGEALAGGWHARFRPLRVFGAWPRMPGLPSTALPDDPEEPAAALTLGRPRPGRLASFLRASKPAEREALVAPGLVVTTGFARPPRLVSTFSVWQSVAQMRDYARGPGGAHQLAFDRDRERPFHRESAFIRLRPLHSAGLWDGRDPLAGLTPAERAPIRP